MYEKKGSRQCRGRISVQYKILKKTQTEESISLQSTYEFSGRKQILFLPRHTTFNSFLTMSRKFSRENNMILPFISLVSHTQKYSLSLGRKVKANGIFIVTLPPLQSFCTWVSSLQTEEHTEPYQASQDLQNKQDNACLPGVLIAL